MRRFCHRGAPCRACLAGCLPGCLACQRMALEEEGHGAMAAARRPRLEAAASCHLPTTMTLTAHKRNLHDRMAVARSPRSAQCVCYFLPCWLLACNAPCSSVLGLLTYPLSLVGHSTVCTPLLLQGLRDFSTVCSHHEPIDICSSSGWHSTEPSLHEGFRITV